MKNLFILLTAITIAACNPVARAFKPKHIEKTKEEFFMRKLCINDTTIITKTVHDSTIIKDSQIVIKYLDKRFNFYLDTVINGAHLHINNGSVGISYPEKVHTVYQTQTVTNTVRDKSLEGLLEKKLAFTDSVLSDTKVELAETHTKLTKARGYVLLLILLVIGYIAFRIYRFIKP